MSVEPLPSTGPGQMFEIADQEVGGIVMPVFVHAPPSLRAVWDLSAFHGDAVYLVYEDERLTYAGAHQKVASLAAYLVDEAGVRPGDRIAIAMRNFPEWALAFWAAASIGAVVVPLNAWWTGAELEYGLADSGTTLLFADGERLERVESRLRQTSVRTAVAVRVDGPAPSGTVAFGDLVADADATLPTVEIQPDDDATIMYTSGTTGRPKGAVGTHRNMGAFVMNLLWWAASRPSVPSSEDGSAGAGNGAGRDGVPTSTLLTLPLFHVGGLQSFLLPFTAIGGKLAMLYKWDPAAALDLIEREELSTVAGVPTTVFELLDEARRQGRELPSLAGVSSGATLVPPELVRRIDDQFSSRAAPTNGYGLTETTGAVFVNSGRAYLDHPDSVGRPIAPVMAARIVDPEGAELPVGEVGEIWLRGPTIVRGYFGLDEATADAFTDGWFHTGDLGRLDDDGYLHVLDRIKDLIIRGGENVYAAEVEAVLYEHPDVVEVAVVGVPHPRLGEEVAAVVRLRPEAAADAEVLRAFTSEHLAAFKVPAIVSLTADELPRNATGKILKRQLREELATAAGAPG